MSLSTIRLRPKLVVSNTVAVENIHNLEAAVKKGPKSILGKEFSPSSYSSQGIAFTFYPNSLTTFVDRSIYLRQTFRVTVNGVGGASGNILDFGVFSALRAYPLHRCMTIFSLSINGTSETYQPNWFIPYAERFPDSDEWSRENASMTPTRSDVMQEYAMAYNGNSNQLGITQDPLSSYGQSDKLQGGGRGQFGPGVSIAIVSGNNSPGTGVAGSVVIDITLTECLIHPFFRHLNQTLQLWLVFVKWILISPIFRMCLRIYGPNRDIHQLV